MICTYRISISNNKPHGYFWYLCIDKCAICFGCESIIYIYRARTRVGLTALTRWNTSGMLMNKMWFYSSTISFVLSKWDQKYSDLPKGATFDSQASKLFIGSESEPRRWANSNNSSSVQIAGCNSPAWRPVYHRQYLLFSPRWLSPSFYATSPPTKSHHKTRLNNVHSVQWIDPTTVQPIYNNDI